MRQWYPHYPGDYLRDTLQLTLEEDGAYRRLLDHYYTTGCALPVDRFKLARILRVSPQKAARMAKVLANFFEEKNELLYHKRIEFELHKSLKNHERAVANGAAGGKATAVARAVANGVASIPTTIYKNTPPTREAILSDFQPSEETIEYARSRRLPDPCNQEIIDQFINTNQSSNWQSANWQSEYRKFLPKWKVNHDKQKQLSSRKLSAVERVELATREKAEREGYS